MPGDYSTTTLWLLALNPNGSGNVSSTHKHVLELQPRMCSKMSFHCEDDVRRVRFYKLALEFTHPFYDIVMVMLLKEVILIMCVIQALI